MGRVELANRPHDELIAHTVRQAKCSCGRRGGDLVDVTIGMTLINVHERPISFEGNVTARLGMN
jgi:hypothetical protein